MRKGTGTVTMRIVHKSGTESPKKVIDTAPSIPPPMTPIGGNKYEVGELSIIISAFGKKGRELDRRRLTKDQRDRLMEEGYRWDDKSKTWRRVTNVKVYTLVPWEAV